MIDDNTPAPAVTGPGHGRLVGVDVSKRTCSIADCGKRAIARGWCHTHYKRWQTTGDPQPDVPVTAICTICTIAECNRKHKAKGLCDKHYQRLYATGTTDDSRVPTDDERFWPKVLPTGFCWYWAGGKTKLGYGVFRWNGRSGCAHRWAYESLVGPIPEGLDLDHLCRNPSCVNPDHLEPVTTGENIRRGIGWWTVSALQRDKTHCPKGHLYSEANTRVYRGRRHCRACGRERRKRTPS